jgi:hypothetical protein
VALKSANDRHSSITPVPHGIRCCLDRMDSQALHGFPQAVLFVDRGIYRDTVATGVVWLGCFVDGHSRPDLDLFFSEA